MKRRIILADDHVLVRAGLSKLLAGYEDCVVLAEASNGREAVTSAREHEPDIAILDISMPELNGIDACRRIVELVPRCAVILLSMHATEEFVLQGLAAGARGYVLKDAAPEELEQAIRAVAAGGTYLSPKVTGKVLESMRKGPDASPTAVLSGRQREVLQLIAEGRSTREIAERLHISVKTVETHRAQIMQKLDIRDIAGLTRYALRVGLIS